MFRGGYGVLKLLPRDLYKLTLGEYADMMTARAWVQQQQNGTTPLVGPARDVAVAEFDAAVRRKRG